LKANKSGENGEPMSGKNKIINKLISKIVDFALCPEMIEIPELFFTILDFIKVLLY